MKKIFLSVLAVAGFYTAQAQIPTNGLIDRWQFNGNLNNSITDRLALIPDSVFFCNDLVLPNNAPLYTTDRNNNQGNAYINRVQDRTITNTCVPLPSAAPHPFNNSLRSQDSVEFGTQDRTIAVWVKYVGKIANAKIFYAGKRTNKNSFGLDLKPIDATLGPNATAFTYGPGNDIIDSVPSFDQNWHQYVFVKSADVITLYLDGNQLGTQTVTGINTLNSIFKVGNYNDSVALDDLRIWNRGLTSTEVSGLSSAALVCPTITSAFTNITETSATVTVTGTVNYPITVIATSGPTQLTSRVSSAGSGGIGGLTAGKTYYVRLFDAKGCEKLDTFTTIGIDPTGINDIALASKISIYPNPATNVFTVQTSAVVPSIHVTDIVGKVIFSQKDCKEVTQIATAQWTNGVYLVTVESNGQKATQRLVVAK